MSEDTAHGRSHQKSGKKKLTVTQQNIYEKPFTSNPRTNDSLGHIA